MKTYQHQYYLLVAGLTMLAVGGYVSLMPHAYLLSLGVESKTLFDGNGINSNLLSDLRGMGGMLLFTGIFIFISSFRLTWQRYGLLMSALIYTAFIVFRTLSFLIEGLPAVSLIIAYSVELILAIIGLLLIKTGER